MFQQTGDPDIAAMKCLVGKLVVLLSKRLLHGRFNPSSAVFNISHNLWRNEEF